MGELGFVEGEIGGFWDERRLCSIETHRVLPIFLFNILTKSLP